MNRITIDLETKSDRDITKCGVYAYADSPYFDILLFSYSIDDDEVQVVDIANGEKIPDDILKALTDETIIKRAFNVNFESICLSRYLAKNYPIYFQSYSVGEDTVGDYLNPKSWHCTMIHSRTLGLPSSLARGGDIYCETASQMFGVPVEKHGINGHLRQRGKQAALSCSYGGSVGALKAMGAIENGMKEEELKPMVDKWRAANPNIVRFWYDVDDAAKQAIKEKNTTETHGISFIFGSNMLFIELPSGRRLVALKFKKQCELCKLCIIALNENAVIIQLFTKNLSGKICRNKGNFQFSLIPGIVVDNVINTVVSKKVVRTAACVD